jgi:glutathione S-transferase
VDVLRAEPHRGGAGVGPLHGPDRPRRAAAEVFAAKVAAARRSLETVERGLADGRPFLTGDDYTVADIALHAYVHCGADAGVDTAAYPHIPPWLARVEATPGFENDLAPIPAHAMV